MGAISYPAPRCRQCRPAVRTTTAHSFPHKLSRQLVDENQAIAVEDLCVKAMAKAPTSAKAVCDAGWSMLTRFCAYKCGRVGKPFQRTDRFFPSSKLCHCCGHRCTEMPLSVRQWTCPGCGVVHDRDENAARNIGQEADRIWALGTRAPVGGGTVRHGRRSWRSVQVPMKPEARGFSPEKFTIVTIV